jgi:hypothetical protein
LFPEKTAVAGFIRRHKLMELEKSRLKTFRRKLADSKRRICHVQFAALSGMADDVARFEKLKAEDDAGYDDEVDEVLCDAKDAQEDRLLAHIDSLVLRQRYRERP